jgi:hypothetical protein
VLLLTEQACVFEDAQVSRRRGPFVLEAAGDLARGGETAPQVERE